MEKELLNFEDISQEKSVVWYKAFIRETGESVDVNAINTEEGELIYFDKNDKQYHEIDLCVPAYSCVMEQAFNMSGNAVFAKLKESETQIAVEPIDDNGFVFYRDEYNNVYSLLDLVLSNQKAGKKLRFETLEDRMLYYRAKPEQYISKNSYVIVMLDGKNFSQKIKRKYKRPFDNNFIKLMNDTAAYVCSKIQGAKFAYVQSDEISIFFSDADSPKSTLFYDGRVVKLLSIIPAIATSYFNRHVLDDKLAIENLSASDIRQIVENEDLYQFDAKVWTLPTLTEVWNWFLYRNRDCTKNSKQQAAQTYLPQNKLKNVHTDDQIKMLVDEKGIDWHTDYDDGQKYGRFIYKEKEQHTREFRGESIPYERSVWKSHYGRDLDAEGSKEWFMKTLIEPCGFPETDTVSKTFEDILSENKMYCEKLLKNLAYLSELNEVFPDKTDDYCENLIDNQYSDIKEIILQTDVIIGKLKENSVKNC